MPDERSTSSQAGGDDYFYEPDEAETAAPLPWYRSPWVLGGLVVTLIVIGAFALLARNGDDASEASATTVASLTPSSSTTATSEPAPTTAATSTTEPPTTTEPPAAIATTPPATVDTDEVATTVTTAPPATVAPETSEPITTEPPATAATTPPTTEAAPATTVAAAISYSGSGGQTIDLAPGSPESIDRWAMRIAHTGSEAFAISTVDANGDPATVIDVTGPYAGDRAFGFGVVDIETIEVATAGDWTIELIPVDALPVLGADAGATLEGTGDRLIRFAPGRTAALGFECDDCAGPIVVNAYASISSTTVLDGAGTGSSFLSIIDVAADVEVLAIQTVSGDVPGTWRLAVNS